MAKKDPDIGDIINLATKGFEFGTTIGKLFSKKSEKTKNNESRINRSVKNNQKASSNFRGANTADIASLIGQYHINAITNPVPRSMTGGDRILGGSFTDYQIIMERIAEESKLQGQIPSSNIPKPYQYSPKIATRRAIDNASIMFSQNDTDDVIVLIKAISGLVSTMGGDPQVSEILTFIVKKRYPYDVRNIYNATVQENWVGLASTLVVLVQKLNMDKEFIIKQMEKIASNPKTNQILKKQNVRQFATYWRQQDQPFVGATMISANMLNSIKGIITPKHFR